MPISKILAIKRLARFKSFKFRMAAKKSGTTAKVIAAGTVGGATAGGLGAEAGLRNEGVKEGLVQGALATAAGVIVFRRIRGRIIPIRKKR